MVVCSFVCLFVCVFVVWLGLVWLGQDRASAVGQDGAMFPWTSTLSGYDDTHSTTPHTGLGWTEQHVTADVALAFRHYFFQTGDDEFLRRSWSLINGTCAFWAGRSSVCLK